MAYTLQLRDVRNSSVKNVASVCATGQEFADRVNEVSRRLLRRGGWWNTEQVVRLCTQGCHIVFPRQVGTVLGMRFCRSGAAQIKNNWWSVYGYHSCNGWYGSGWRGDTVVRDDGTRPCYNEITGNTGKYIRYHITRTADIGKTIRLFGFQYGNQPLQEVNADGDLVMGLTLTAAVPDAQTTVLVTQITSVVREATEARGFLYEVDPVSGDLHDLAVYEPDETNPAYRCSVVQNWSGVPFHTDSAGRRIRQVEALVKLAFVPAVTDDDFVMIDNLSALKLGMQALQLEEANQDELAQAKLLLAVKELNLELRDKEPGMQTVVSVNSISSNYCISNPI